MINGYDESFFAFSLVNSSGKGTLYEAEPDLDTTHSTVRILTLTRCFEILHSNTKLEVLIKSRIKVCL
jgi:hypothetical protein